MTPDLGQVLWYFLSAIILTIPASFIVVVGFRRAVHRSMRRSSGLQQEVSVPGPAPAVSVRDAGVYFGNEGRIRKRLAVIYAAAIVVAAVVLMVFWKTTTDLELTVFRAFVIVWILAWPLAAVAPTLLAMPRRWAWLLPALHVVVGAAINLLWSLVSLYLLRRHTVQPALNLTSYAMLLATEAVLPFLTIEVTGNRKVRGVSPLVMAALMLFAIGSLVTHAVVKLFWDSDVLFKALPDPRLFVWLWSMIMALPAGYLCWLSLRGLARGYRRKSFSDIQMVVDSWMFVAVMFMLPWTPGPTAALLGLLAFVAYRLVVAAGLALWPLAAERSPPRLLVLRVFGFQKRTEDLYDRIVQRWRWLGSVNMIGGADLAGRTIDPGETVAFLSGSLTDLFVRTGVELQRKLAEFDDRRDPDGRFRVNELYCHQDTWQPALESLLGRSDRVLMDLRSFAEANSGCRFELAKIAQTGRLGTTVFVVDQSSDLALLRACLGAPDDRSLNLVRVSTGSPPELDAVFSSLRDLSQTS